MFGFNKAPKEIKMPELEKKQDRILWTAIGTGVLAFIAYSGGAFFAAFVLGVLAFGLFYKGATMKTTVKPDRQYTTYR
jgi:hypothetical protein